MLTYLKLEKNSKKRIKINCLLLVYNKFTVGKQRKAAQLKGTFSA